MPLPTSRDTDYTGGTPIKPDDLNSIQDQIIAGYTRWSARQTWAISLQSRHEVTGSWTTTTAGPPQGQGKLTINAAAAEALFGISVPIGGRLDGFSVRCQDGGSATTLFAAQLAAMDDSGNTILNSPVKLSSGTGAKQTLSDTGLNYLVHEGRYYLRCFLSGGALATRTLWHASYSFYLPL